MVVSGRVEGMWAGGVVSGRWSGCEWMVVEWL